MNAPSDPRSPDSPLRKGGGGAGEEERSQRKGQARSRLPEAFAGNRAPISGTGLQLSSPEGFRLALSRTVRIAVPLPPGEALSVLRGIIGRKRRPFLGQIEGRQFRIQRVEDYRSTFLPLMKGRLVEAPGGTEVLVKMRPHRQVLLFLAIWYCFLALFALLALSLAAGWHRLLLAVPLALGLSTWALTLSVFESDCRWAAHSLAEALRLPGPSGLPPVRNPGEGA